MGPTSETSIPPAALSSAPYVWYLPLHSMLFVANSASSSTTSGSPCVSHVTSSVGNAISEEPQLHKPHTPKTSTQTHTSSRQCPHHTLTWPEAPASSQNPARASQSSTAQTNLFRLQILYRDHTLHFRVTLKGLLPTFSGPIPSSPSTDSQSMS